MFDFTIILYKKLLYTFIELNLNIQTFQDYLEQSKNQFLIIRHDVDHLPHNSLLTAQIENDIGIKSTYYFRTIPQTFKSEIIKQIISFGHEIGYHYENMDTCHGDIDKAWDDFSRNLEKLRKLYPVKTICMHGSPLSLYDNRDLWKKYVYRSVGIIGEPYLDVNWDDVFYLTDTGRRWDGGNVSIRDRIKRRTPACRPGRENGERIWPVYHTTSDIIRAIENGNFPQKAMITTHPQRWTDKPLPWLKELIWQNVKNVVKNAIVKRRKGDIENG